MIRRNFIFQICALFLILGKVCASGNPAFINLNEFSKDTLENSLIGYQEQVVQLRGFWTPLNENEGILSSQINLKSCCVRSPAKIQEQVLVKGDVHSFPTQSAITLEGIFRIDPIRNAQGNLIQLYVLEEAKITNSSNHWLIWILFLIFSLLIISLFLKFLNKEDGLDFIHFKGH